MGLINDYYKCSISLISWVDAGGGKWNHHGAREPDDLVSKERTSLCTVCGLDLRLVIQPGSAPSAGLLSGADAKTRLQEDR